MKKIVLLLLLGFLFCNTSYAQKYFGKSYPQTQSVDAYFDESNIKNDYHVMGLAELDQGFRSLEKCQEKLISLAKKKGADGIIFFIEKEVYGTSTSGGATLNEKKKNKTTASANSSTVELTKKTITAKLIKYD